MLRDSAPCPQCQNPIRAIELRWSRTNFGGLIRPVICKNCGAELATRGGKWRSIIANIIIPYASFFGFLFVLDMTGMVFVLSVGLSFLASVLARLLLFVRLMGIEILTPGPGAFD